MRSLESTPGENLSACKTLHGSTVWLLTCCLALRLDESFGTDAVLRASQSAIRNLRAIGDLDEEWFAPDWDCAKDGSSCISNRLYRLLMVAATPAKKVGKVRSYATEGA